MKAVWEKIEKNQGVLTVEVNEEMVATALDRAFKKVAPKVNVPGFRKGKVPRSIFEAKYGIESLYQDAIDIILPEAYTDAVKETGIEPVDRPEVDVEAFSKGQPFKFTAKVLVKPEVSLGEYKGVEVPEKDNSVSPEEINEELSKLQMRHAELVVLEEGTAENGDTAIIDFDGSVDGVPFEGGKAENHSLELGSGSFIPGFEDQVVGMVIDEDRDVKVTFPESYHAAELAGKDAVFKVRLHDIKRKSLPALDDEFAKDVSDFETLDEYKQDIEKRLREKKEHSNLHEREAAVVDLASAAAEVEIPEIMFETEQENMLKDFANRLRMQGMNLELYYQYTGQNEEALKHQMRGDAEKRVRNQLVLEAIAKAENIAASDAELDEELETMSKTYQKSADELKAILTANGSLESLKEDIATKKTIKFLVDNSKSISGAA